MDRLSQLAKEFGSWRDESLRVLQSIETRLQALEQKIVERDPERLAPVVKVDPKPSAAPKAPTPTEKN